MMSRVFGPENHPRDTGKPDDRARSVALRPVSATEEESLHFSLFYQSVAFAISFRVAFLKSSNVPGPPCPLGNMRGLCKDKLLKSLPT